MWPRREPWSRPGFPWSRPPAAAWPPTLGYEDHEGAPGDEMLAAAARIAGGVEVPVTVDAEAGYGMEPAELVAALRSAGAAGCNLEDSDYAAGGLRDPDRHAEWLRAVRQAASDGRLPARDQRPGRRLRRTLPRRLPAPGLRRSSFPKRCGARMPTSRPASTACYPIGLWETGRSAPLHLGGPRPGQRHSPAAGAVARRAGRAGRGPGELGNPPAPRRDGSLRGTARLASGVRTGRDQRPATSD